MFKTEEEYQKAIELAKANGACIGDIEELKTMSRKEFLRHRSLPYWLYWYCIHVLKAPRKGAEKAVFTDIYYAYYYCCHFNTPNKDAEKIIFTRPCYAYDYCKYILKAPNKDAEKIIFTDPDYAYWYCRNVLKAPNKDAEKIIFTDPEIAYDYKKVFNKEDK